MRIRVAFPVALACAGVMATSSPAVAAQPGDLCLVAFQDYVYSGPNMDGPGSYLLYYVFKNDPVRIEGYGPGVVGGADTYKVHRYQDASGYLYRTAIKQDTCHQ